MPLPVVPIFLSGLRFASRAKSTATWQFKINGQPGLIFKRFLTAKPSFSNVSISLSKCPASKTTPLPI